MICCCSRIWDIDTCVAVVSFNVPPRMVHLMLFASCNKGGTLRGVHRCGSCTQMYNHVHRCALVTRVHRSMYTDVHSCTQMYTRDSCTQMYSRV